MNYLSLDTEYTSFYSPDEKKSGEVIQIGVIAIKNGIEVGRKKINLRPLGNVWNVHAEKVHGISKKEVMTFPHPQDAMNELFEFIKSFDCVFTCIGWNCSGDKNYLVRLIRRFGQNGNDWYTRLKPEWKDIKDLAVKNKKNLSGLKNFKLESVCGYFGIQIDAHDALSDAEGTWQVMERLGVVTHSTASSQSIYNVSDIEKRKKYLDTKYVAMDADGTVFITSEATKNREALRIIMEEIWNTYMEN